MSLKTEKLPKNMGYLECRQWLINMFVLKCDPEQHFPSLLHHLYRLCFTILLSRKFLWLPLKGHSIDIKLEAQR
jgi:hypothetical protein